MSGQMQWLALYLILVRVVQFAFWLTNRQFLWIFLIWAVVIFIVAWLTHSDDMPVDEAAEKAKKKVEESVKKIVEETPVEPSGHKAPEPF